MRYYAKDHLGSTVLDGANGELVELVRYGAYGDITELYFTSEELEAREKFTGKGRQSAPSQ
ncbi:MAG: hypothetical protein GF350_04160 [Chitinivibrionales bacterium]|nr:hypothetical protein [Chitinivibrionales bacterium]